MKRRRSLNNWKGILFVQVLVLRFMVNNVGTKIFDLLHHVPWWWNFCLPNLFSWLALHFDQRILFTLYCSWFVPSKYCLEFGEDSIMYYKIQKRVEKCSLITLALISYFCWCVNDPRLFFFVIKICENPSSTQLRTREKKFI